MDDSLRYTSEDRTATLPAAEFIARFRNAQRIGSYCLACSGYGRSWACPPLAFDVEETLAGFTTALIVATKIVPMQSGLPIAQFGPLTRPERLRIENALLEMERLYGGRSFASAGACLHCPEGSCTRPAGTPCRHPERVRPSLEACGFDLTRAASELFGIELRWGTDGQLPEYLTLVSGFFHNAREAAWNSTPCGVGTGLGI